MSALAAAVGLLVPTLAIAHRAATASEKAQIDAAVEKKEAVDQLSGVKWAAERRCNTEKAYVSTVDPHVAGIFFRARYKETDPRYQKCRAQGGETDGVWIAKRAGSGWVGTGWVFGDRDGFCREVKATGISVAAFKDIAGFSSACGHSPRARGE